MQIVILFRILIMIFDFSLHVIHLTKKRRDV